MKKEESEKARDNPEQKVRQQMKLKGHCKVELKDKRTGKIEQYEEHNMVFDYERRKIWEE